MQIQEAKKVSQKTTKFCKAIIVQLKTKQKHYLVWALFGNLKYWQSSQGSKNRHLDSLFQS